MAKKIVVGCSSLVKFGTTAKTLYLPMLFGSLLYVATNPIKSMYRYRGKESVGEIKCYTSYSPTNIKK